MSLYGAFGDAEASGDFRAVSESDGVALRLFVPGATSASDPNVERDGPKDARKTGDLFKMCAINPMHRELPFRHVGVKRLASESPLPALLAFLFVGQ